MSSGNVIAVAGSSIPDWVSGGTTYAIGNTTRDVGIDVYFRCKQSHVSAAKPPSEDPLNWVGQDAERVGQLFYQGHKKITGPNKLMTSGATLSRVKYIRLANAISFVKGPISGTLNSNVMSLGSGDDVDLSIGDTVELYSLPIGTTISTLGTSGTKVATNLLGSMALFYRYGVISTGYQPSYPARVSGPNIGPFLSVTALVPDTTAAVTFASGASYYAALPGVTALNTVITGDYVTSGALIPANARVTSSFPNQTTLANAGAISGSNQLMAPFNMESVQGIVAANLPGRFFTKTGFVSPTSISSVVDPEYAMPGSWSYITNLGLFSPWDVLPADVTKLVLNRKIGLDGVLTSDSNSLASMVSPKNTLQGSTSLGVASYFWKVGTALFPQMAERRVGNLIGSIPALTYIVAHQVEVSGVYVGTVNGLPNIFFPTGAVVNGVVGQYATFSPGGISQERISGVVPEFTIANVGFVSGNTLLRVTPAALPLPIIGQRATAPNIPASTTIISSLNTADYPVPKYSVNNGSAGLNVPVLSATAPYVLQIKITGTGIPVNTWINTINADASDSNVGSLNGVGKLFFPVGGATVPYSLNRYVNFAGMTDALISAAAVSGASITNTRTNTGVNKIFQVGTGAITPVIFSTSIVAGCYVTASGFVAPSRLTAVNAGVDSATQGAGRFFRSSVTGTNIIGLPAGVIAPLVGQGLSTSNLAAGSVVIANASPDVFIASVAATAGQQTYTSSAGLFTASMVGLQFTHAGAPGSAIRITSFVNANNITGAIGATITTTAPATIGQSVQMNVNASSTGVDNYGLEGYLTADTSCTAGGSSTATTGPTITTNGTATSTLTIGSTLALGSIHVLSSAATATTLDSTSGILGSTYVLSAAATSSSNTASVILGRVLNLTAVPNSTTVGPACNLGPVSTLSAPATLLDTSTLTFGTFSLISTVYPTNRNMVAVQVGAILQASATATAAQGASAIVFGPGGTFDLAATGAGSQVTALFGGHHTVDQNSTVGNDADAVFSFGAQMTVSNNCTSTSANFTAKIWPYGGGDGTTTFGIGMDVVGRVIAVSGLSTAPGATVQPLNTLAGRQTYALTTAEIPSHTHAVNDPGHLHYVSYQNFVSGAGSGSSGAAFTSNSGQGSGSTPTNGAGTGITLASTGSGTAHALLQPTAFAAKSFAVYAGAV